MSSPSVGETAHKVGTSETHASPGSSPKKRDVYRFPSPRIAGMEEGSPIRAISPSWSPATASRMVDSRRNSPAVPSSPLVDAENQGLVAYDDRRVPVATIANEMDVGEPLVGLSSAKEVSRYHKYSLKSKHNSWGSSRCFFFCGHSTIGLLLAVHRARMS